MRARTFYTENIFNMPAQISPESSTKPVVHSSVRTHGGLDSEPSDTFEWRGSSTGASYLYCITDKIDSEKSKKKSEPVPAPTAPVEDAVEHFIEGSIVPTTTLEAILVLNYTLGAEFNEWFSKSRPINFKELVNYTLKYMYGVHLDYAMKLVDFKGFTNELTRQEFAVVATYKFGFPRNFIKHVIETAVANKTPFMHVMFECLFGMLFGLSSEFSTYFLDDADGKIGLQMKSTSNSWTADHTKALVKLFRDNTGVLTPEESMWAPKRADGRALTFKIFTR